MQQCKKCPHHVRHGQVAGDGKTIEFKNRCGLKMKEPQPVECSHHPFSTKGFDYIRCDIYVQVFKSQGQRNDVVPTSDFQYSEKLANSSLTEMELL
jgi:hypothetical protein